VRSADPLQTARVTVAQLTYGRFGGVPWSQIRKKEMCAWLYWSLFYERIPDFDKIPPAHHKALLDCLDLIEKRTGTTIPEGSNPKAHPKLVTLDPVNVLWRPLIYYLFVALGDFIIKQSLIHFWGMTLGTRHGLDYLVRVPPTWDAHKGPTPLVFVYGLGLGLLLYNSSVYNFLICMPDRPLFILLQPHSSQLFFHPRFLVPKTRKETVIIMRQLCIDFGWVPSSADTRKGDTDRPKPKGITLASHSNGSYVHAWILKDAPDLVARSLFIDPVTFCSWEGGMFEIIMRSSCCKTHVLSRQDLCLKFLYDRATTVSKDLALLTISV
jgi:hypothetical protein